MHLFQIDQLFINYTNCIFSDIAEQCANFGLGDSLLEKEALAAIREVGFAVRMISLPESLPRTTDLIFMNLITLEGISFFYLL